ncbi:hypothetical protein DD237_004581 [Peronospora effusa]|uniref:Superoxide dismutase copper/zinc binding domain-containing protein n=1 Tax=Peronospora effusa TaxID=542832 RepID=A0A425CGF4_9STRA|nr:hypothetical protein DD237_004581 [Peronospora effusa]
MIQLFGSICIFTVALARAAAADNPSFVYNFKASDAAGIDGTIKVNYAAKDSTVATITAELDFSTVDQKKITTFDGNCTGDVTSYKWHIHTGWNSAKSSDSLKLCSKTATGNHYDPLKACGPASEYVAEPECKAKSLTYACNPAAYMADPMVCEKGDLSGKFGALTPGSNHKVSEKWTDSHYPLASESTKTWSIVLHAVCGKETPRVSCALGNEQKEHAKEDGHKKKCR